MCLKKKKFDPGKLDLGLVPVFADQNWGDKYTVSMFGNYLSCYVSLNQALFDLTSLNLKSFWLK